MCDFVYTQKDIGYGYRWTFPNKHRVDMIDYQKTGTTIMRVWRGSWLAQRYPLLHGWFDEVLGVIAKIELSHSSVLELKNVKGVLQLLYDAPAYTTKIIHK